MTNPENVTEIVRFYDFKLNDEEAASIAFTRGLDGCVRSYHGSEVNGSDDGKNGVWVQEWLSLAHHVAFQNSPEYPGFVARVASFASTEKLEILHAQLRPYPAESPFTAPLTEMTFVTPKPSATNESLEAVLKEAQEKLTDLSYGVIMEDSSCKQYIIVNGWQSIEEFERAKLDSSFLKKLNEVAEITATRLYKLKF